jgi:cation transport protein ChaC
VFAYASLIWNPDLPIAHTQAARVFGYHRDLCMRSVAYRGTEKTPGLVFALDRGGSCRGVVYQITKGQEQIALDALWAREMPRQAYAPSYLSVQLQGSKTGAPQKVQALCFVIDRARDSYVGRLSLATQAQWVRHACGTRGSCLDYVKNTQASLLQFGIVDHKLTRLCALLNV